MLGITEEIQNRLKKANNLADKIKVLLDAKIPDVMYNVVQDDVEVVPDIALIQCFHGTNIARIRATTTAIEFNLQTTRKPSTWIFVECQRKKEDCAFKWLERYGIKHHFIQSKEENEPLMLKQSLWNFGTTLCSESRLCFVDSDVVMCNSDWIEKIAKRFEEGYEVLSLAAHQYYQFVEDCKFHDTIGYAWETRGEKNRHVGFTMGFTRKAFREFGGFDAVIHHFDDVNTYHKLFGHTFRDLGCWRCNIANLRLDDGHYEGYNLKFSYADNIACHIWHGEEPEKNYWGLSRLIWDSGLHSVYDVIEWKGRDPKVLPKWRTDTGRSRAMRSAIQAYYENYTKTPVEGFDPVQVYYDRMREILGVPDKKHPLYVCTVVKDGMGRDLDAFKKFRDNVEQKFAAVDCDSIPQVVFFSDVGKVDFAQTDLNVFPLKNYDRTKEFEQCLRKDLKLPKGVVIYYIPFDCKDFNAKIWVPDEKIENPNGSMLFQIENCK